MTERALSITTDIVSGEVGYSEIRLVPISQKKYFTADLAIKTPYSGFTIGFAEILGRTFNHKFPNIGQEEAYLLCAEIARRWNIFEGMADIEIKEIETIIAAKRRNADKGEK